MQHTSVTQTQGSVEAVKDQLLMDDPSLVARNVSDPIAWQLGKEGHGVITAYSSGKIVIQATDAGWMEQIAESVAGDSPEDEEFVPHIGVDETGKGDFFGPLVVAAVFVGSVTEADKLRAIGVRDSKMISDREIQKIYPEISKICSSVSEVVISPEEYNEENKKVRNANKILAGGHARAIEDVLDSIPKGDCTLIVVDQFSKDKSRVLDALLTNGSKLKVQQMHKGERDVAVAAASITARGRFLNEMDKMGKTYDCTFPKGASNVIGFGKEFVQKWGRETLHTVAKTSFKTAIQITSTFDL